MEKMGRRRSAWQCWSTVLIFGIVVTWTAVAGVAPEDVATQVPSNWPEVMNLEEAARYLRLDPQKLEAMAIKDLVPARRIGTDWRFNREALLAWLTGEWGLIVAALPPSGEALSSTETLPSTALSSGAAPLAQVARAGSEVVQSQVDSGAQTDKEADPIGEAPEALAAEDVFLRGLRVLLRPGDVNVDFGIFYSESDNQQLALVNGGFGLADLSNEAFTGFFLGRYGLFDETEVFFDTTYIIQDTDLRVADQTLSSSSRSEFGDVHLGFRNTLLKESVGLPDVILTLDGRIPTNNDHTSYSVGGGIALVKSIDPVVLFANINYRHTFSKDFDDVTRLEPENRVDVSLGYAFAVNDTLSFNTTLFGLFTDKNEFDNATLRRQELFMLQFGLTAWLAEGLYIEPTVGFGLNGPGDSFFLGVTLPYNFSP